MTDAGPGGDPSIVEVIRDAGPAALGALLRRGEPFTEAEDAVQEALLLAVESWPAREIPDRPVGWLVRVAQRRLIDAHRADSTRRHRESLAASWSTSSAIEPVADVDDSVTLLFMCCHPDLTASAAIPLTLRAVGGLSTREIADALLTSEATIAQRISRAKATITRSSEPFRPPPPDLLDNRLANVMQVVYLVFTEGHAATSGPQLVRADLATEAIRLARQLHIRMPDTPEVAGLLALMLLTDARRGARTDPAGELVPLDRQDRRLWNRSMITEGLTLLTASMGHQTMGVYQLQAAIAAVHDQAPSYTETHWPELRALYNVLVHLSDNPLLRLNQTVAIAHTDGADTALSAAADLADKLSSNHRYHATIGYLYELAGNHAAARLAYDQAAHLASNEPERRYLQLKAAWTSAQRVGIDHRVDRGSDTKANGV